MFIFNKRLYVITVINYKLVIYVSLNLQGKLRCFKYGALILI